MSSKKELLDKKLDEAIIEYVNEYPGCSANAITAALLPRFKQITIHEVASRIINLGDEIRWEDHRSDLRIYYPADKTEYELLNQEEILNYTINCFIEKNNFPIPPLEISAYIRTQLKKDDTQKKLIYEDLEKVLEESFITEKLPNVRRFKLKTFFYQNYLENKE